MMLEIPVHFATCEESGPGSSPPSGGYQLILLLLLPPDRCSGADPPWPRQNHGNLHMSCDPESRLVCSRLRSSSDPNAIRNCFRDLKSSPEATCCRAQVLEILLPAIYLSDHFTAAVATSNLITISEADLHNKSKFVHHPRQEFWTVVTIFGRRGYDQAGSKDQIWKCWKLLR